jgi:uncharacterized protein YcgL (UPF0745 family)
MRTWVYKSSRRENTYLFIDHENNFDNVPEALVNLLGDLTLVIDVVLEPGRKLAQADPVDVMHHINNQGYFLQLPPGDSKPEKLC